MERCSVCDTPSSRLTEVFNDVGVCAWLCSWCFTNGMYWYCGECDRFNTHIVSGNEWCFEECGPAPGNFDTYALWCVMCVERLEKERHMVLAGLDARVREGVLALSREWEGEFAELVDAVKALMKAA